MECVGVKIRTSLNEFTGRQRLVNSLHDPYDSYESSTRNVWSAIGAKNQTMYSCVHIIKRTYFKWTPHLYLEYTLLNFGTLFSISVYTLHQFQIHTSYSDMASYSDTCTSHDGTHSAPSSYSDIHFHIRHSLDIPVYIILHVRIHTSHSVLTSRSALSSYSETHFIFGYTLHIRHFLRIQQTLHSDTSYSDTRMSH